MKKLSIAKMALAGVSAGLLMASQAVAAPYYSNDYSSDTSSGYGSCSSRNSGSYYNDGYNRGTVYSDGYSRGDSYSQGSYGSCGGMSSMNNGSYYNDGSYSTAIEDNSNRPRIRGDYTGHGNIQPNVFFRVRTDDSNVNPNEQGYYPSTTNEQGYYPSRNQNYYQANRSWTNEQNPQRMQPQNSMSNMEPMRSDKNILTEQELFSQLNENGKNQYNQLDSKGKMIARQLAAQSNYSDKNQAVKDAANQTQTRTDSYNYNTQPSSSNTWFK